MASSVDHNYGGGGGGGGTTAAPPPTPSSQTNHLSTSAAADALSRLLHRLPPNLSLPTRRSPSVSSPPTISFSESSNPSLLDRILSASSEFGFFQITDHQISSVLALSAESESAALFDLPIEKKESLFPKNWPLGYKGGDGEEDSDGDSFSFCIDSSDSAEISLNSLQEFVRAMEKLGLKIVEALSRAIGFENPIGEDRTRFRSLIWISEGPRSSEPSMASGFYPYIVGLQYQSSNRKCSMLADSGWVTAAAAADSVIVSIGDIAQVWSNGKVKKVRGRPMPMAADPNGGGGGTVSISVLITLPADSQVCPQIIPTKVVRSSDPDEGEEEEKMAFNSFWLEDYAWRVYDDRCFVLKDPLHRYRI